MQGSDSRTDFNYNANMPVVGQNCYILSDSGTSAEVNAFSPGYETKNIPILEEAVLYHYPEKMMTYILVIRNAFHVTSVTKNLPPPLYDGIGGDNGVRHTPKPKWRTPRPRIILSISKKQDL